MSARPVRVFVSAGEASGDRILGVTLERLRAEIGELELCGLGGPRAQAQGLHPLFPIARTAFSGAWDVAKNLPFAARMDFAARRALRRCQPHLALLVDYPGLNLRLARAARAMGIPVHFIAPPQAWAYRDREAKLRRARAALQGCSLQPLYAFEAADWKGFPVATGHFQDTVIPRLPKSGLIALCPGSRLPVLRRNLPAWLRLLDSIGLPPETPMAVVAPPFLAAEAGRIARLQAPHRWARGAGSAKVTASARIGLLVRTDSDAVLAEASRAVAFPGTITLELACRRVPTLVLALLDPLTFALGRRVLARPHLALPNLLLSDRLFPEWAGTPPGPHPSAFRALWDSLPSPTSGEWERRLAALDQRMGPGDGAGVAARACLGLLGSGASHLVSPVTSALP